ncbi:DUF6383 domain-containing protein [uncultured Parabacteroides sp.]|uniref:DUF6383 domain-containing protein n=1 Tax=uncultured Parabacteroides sp. TaxID=512312 RepID=UPI0025CCE9C9|nr:DUF6383 domain-containing protein [uncultured Parabacteroides sp.]
MSKTITSLIAGLLLSASVSSPMYAYYNEGGHNITFRPTDVMSSDEIDNSVNHFEKDKWYQLVNEDGQLLVQYRHLYDSDMSNGLTLKLVDPGTAPINYSLWSIKASDDGHSGKNFVFVNKETNMELEYGHVKAYTQEKMNETSYPVISFLGGCIQNWNWYTTDRQVSNFDYAPLYSYFSNQDSVVVLRNSDSNPYGGDEILAWKYSKTEAGDDMIDIIDDIVKVKPVLAGSITLDANAINQMVDFQYANIWGGMPADKNVQFDATVTPTKDSPLLTNQFVALDNDYSYFPEINNADELMGLEYGDAWQYVRLQVPGERDEYGDYDTYTTLYVGTEFYENSSKDLKLELMEGDLDASNMPVDIPTLTEKAWIARSLFKFTYYPSQDSLVIEPMNASYKNAASGKWSNANYAFNSTNNDMAAIWNADGSSAPEHNDEYGPVVIRLAYLTENTSVITAKNAEVDGGYELPGSLQTRFFFKNRNFDYLTRTTLSEGLYFIKSTDNGKNVVANLAGRMMFDAPEDDQNYDDMPGTMWVVKQTGCGDRATVAVYNREYAFNYYWFNEEDMYEDHWQLCEEATPVFEGQLYKDKDGNIFFIDESYEGFENKYCYYGCNWQLSNLHTYNFIPVTDNEALTSKYHGYKHLDPESLLYTKYRLNYNLFANGNLYLNVVDNTFMPVESQSTTYELEIAPEDFKATDFEYGYGVGIAGMPQLSRTAYVLKVSDKNLIDNDKMYIALVEEFGKTAYYQPMSRDDIEAGKGKLGVFYLKADQRKDDEKCYILIDIFNNKVNDCNECPDPGPVPTALRNTPAPGPGDDCDECDDCYQYLPRYSYAFNGWRQAHCIDGIGKLSITKLDKEAEDRSSAFAVVTDNRPLYMDLGEEGKHINIYRARGAGQEFLFEDSNNQIMAPQVVKDFGYLGMTAEKIQPIGKDSKTAIYADYVTKSTDRMPQYLFVLRPDSVKDGKWCDAHGYNPNCEHEVDYNGYLAGSFLINLTDSVQGSTNMLNNPDVYKWQSYTRLGFVEGVHQVDATGEYLYILKNGKKLADLRTKDGVLDPRDLYNEAIFEKKPVDGLHKNYAFSLRFTDDDHKDFLLESNKEGVSSIASFKGAWVKIHNGVPVLAEYEVDNGNHVDDKDKMKELINQSQIFNLEDTDDYATSNDEISTSSISIVAGNGSIIVRNASGKVIAVTNVLGQPLVNQTITSDNATIPVPQGVVIVSVEGEKAVKAIVK